LYNESGNPPGDQPAKKDALPKSADGGVKEWNVVSSVGKTERALPAEELAERARIAKPQGGVGCGIDRVPTKEGVRDWYNSLSKGEKAALQDPRAVVTLTATASLVGTREHNDKLTQRRGDETKKILLDLGVKAEIKVEAMGFKNAEERGAPKGKDNHQDRVVYIDIQKAGKGEGQAQPSTEKPSGKEVQPPKGLTEQPRLPKEYDFDKELRDFLKHPIIKEKDLVTTMLKAAKQLIDATGELHDANVAAARLVGSFYSLNIIARDGRVADNPHVQQGKPYTATELGDRTRQVQRYRELMDNDRALCQVYNTGAPKDIERGIAAVADAVNKVLADCKTPAERQVALDKFATTTHRVIGDNREKRLQELRERRGRR